MAKIINCCCFKRSEKQIIYIYIFKKREREYLLLFGCSENEANSDEFFHAIKQTILHVTNNFFSTLVTEKLIGIKLFEN